MNIQKYASQAPTFNCQNNNIIKKPIDKYLNPTIDSEKINDKKAIRIKTNASKYSTKIEGEGGCYRQTETPTDKNGWDINRRRHNNRTRSAEKTSSTQPPRRTQPSNINTTHQTEIL
jgi:hypothetical protein